MRYPMYIKKGDQLGVTAFSDGNRKETDFIRLKNGIMQWKQKGYQVVTTDDVYVSEQGRSGKGSVRAQEFHSLLQQDQVRAVVAARGGDYLVEMLPFVDWDMIKRNPKWIQGYSDTTGILYPITTSLDLATVYASNFSDFGMEIWHESLDRNLLILEGKEQRQASFITCEESFSDRVTGLEGYELTGKVHYEICTGESEICIQGRLLGGCLDVLCNLVGTRFDQTKAFLDRYQEDGVLWYLESFDLNAENLFRALWQLREAGWFHTAKGFLFGRPMLYPEDGISYESVVLDVLGDCHVPIVLGADIGHKAPQFTMINGALGRCEVANGKAILTQQLIP